jgi:uncharacterized membrane protein YqiK
MGLAQEALHENLPLMMGAIKVNPTYVILAGAGIAAAANLRKITPHLHQTVPANHVGVLLRGGKPVKRWFASEEDLASGESQYKILDSGWYPQPPFYSIEPVALGDRQNDIALQLDSKDDKKLDVFARVTWHVSPEGDNPVHSITRVKHEFGTKKEAPEKDKAEEKRDELMEQVLSICTTGIGTVLSGRKAKQLKNLNLDQDGFHNSVLEVCEEDLLYYGVKLRSARINPIVRADSEVQAQSVVKAQRLVADAIRENRDDPEKGGGILIPMPFRGDAA